MLVLYILYCVDFDGEPEISQLDVALFVEEDVGGLEISVDEASFVEIDERLQNLLDQFLLVFELLSAESLLLLVSLAVAPDDVLQSPSRAVLHLDE